MLVSNFLKRNLRVINRIIYTPKIAQHLEETVSFSLASTIQSQIQKALARVGRTELQRHRYTCQLNGYTQEVASRT